NFAYDGNGRLSNVTDSAARQIGYGYAANGTLTSYTDAQSRITTYSYLSGRFVPLLNKITDPWGRVVRTVTFYPSDKLKTYTEAGETYTYTYTNSTTTTKADSGGNQWTFNFNSYGEITQKTPP